MEKVEELQRMLSPDELRRALRFRFPEHRRRFTVARANLRIVLAEYTGLKPEELIFETTGNGKPCLTLEQNPGKVSFNISHSHEMAVVALCRDSDIGVDLEYMDKARPFSELAQRYFTGAEYDMISRLAEMEQAAMFYKIWTLKEAWLKASGLGIMGLGLIETCQEQEGNLGILHWGEDTEDYQEFKPRDYRHFEPEPGYLAAYTRLYSSQTVSTR